MATADKMFVVAVIVLISLMNSCYSDHLMTSRYSHTAVLDSAKYDNSEIAINNVDYFRYNWSLGGHHNREIVVTWEDINVTVSGSYDNDDVQRLPVSRMIWPTSFAVKRDKNVEKKKETMRAMHGVQRAAFILVDKAGKLSTISCEQHKSLKDSLNTIFVFVESGKVADLMASKDAMAKIAGEKSAAAFFVTNLADNGVHNHHDHIFGQVPVVANVPHPSNPQLFDIREAAKSFCVASVKYFPNGLDHMAGETDKTKKEAVHDFINLASFQLYALDGDTIIESVLSLTHEQGNSMPVYPVYTPPSYQRGRLSWQTHTGTHADAPKHFQRSDLLLKTFTDVQADVTTVDKPCMRFDFTDKATANTDYGVPASALRDWEKTYGQVPKDSFAFFDFGWTKRYTNATDFNNGMIWPGPQESATRFLIEDRHIAGFGVDTASLDRGKSKLYRTHVVAANQDRLSFELTANLDQMTNKAGHVWRCIVQLPYIVRDGSGGQVHLTAVRVEGETSGAAGSKHAAPIMWFIATVLAIMLRMY